MDRNEKVDELKLSNWDMSPDCCVAFSAVAEAINNLVERVNDLEDRQR